MLSFIVIILIRQKKKDMKASILEEDVDKTTASC